MDDSQLAPETDHHGWRGPRAAGRRTVLPRRFWGRSVPGERSPGGGVTACVYGEHHGNIITAQGSFPAQNPYRTRARRRTSESPLAHRFECCSPSRGTPLSTLWIDIIDPQPRIQLTRTAHPWLAQAQHLPLLMVVPSWLAMTACGTTNRNRPVRGGAALTLSFVMLLAACGSQDDASPTTMAAEQSGTVESAPIRDSGYGGNSDGTATTAAPGVPVDEDAPQAVTVVVNNFSFTPAEIRVAVGGTVTWEFIETVHTVQIDGMTLRSGGETSMTFDTPGTYAYNCGPHPSMQGVVVVG
jgi:plastocyanin